MRIVTVPDASLRQTSHEVLFPLSLTDKNLATTLLDMVKVDSGSAGLAAPQVGVHKRIVIVTDKKRNPKLLINPDITYFSTNTKEFPEGCLSIPDELYLVPRSVTIKYQFRDLTGKTHSHKATGWEARVIQHEIDHLNGILIDDHGTKITKKEAEKYY